MGSPGCVPQGRGGLTGLRIRVTRLFAPPACSPACTSFRCSPAALNFAVSLHPPLFRFPCTHFTSLFSPHPSQQRVQSAGPPRILQTARRSGSGDAVRGSPLTDAGVEHHAVERGGNDGAGGGCSGERRGCVPRRQGAVVVVISLRFEGLYLRNANAAV